MSDLRMATFVRKATSVGTVNIADRAVTVLLGIFLARTLEPSGYGAYSFVMSQVILIAILAKLGLPDLIMRDFAASRGCLSSSNPKLLLQTAIILSSSSSFILIVTGSIILTFFYDGPNASNFQLGLLMIAPMALFEICTGALRGLGHIVISQVVSTLGMTTAVLLSCIFFVSIFHNFSAFDALAIRILILCIFSALVVILAANAMRVEFSKISSEALKLVRPPLLDTLKTSSSFLVIGVLHVLFITVDQLMLGYMVGESSVAIFKVAAEGAQIVAFAYVAGNAVLAPEYSRIFASQNMALMESTAKQSAAIIFAIALPVFMVIFIFSASIVEFAFGEAYAASATPLSILALGHLLALMFGDPLYILNMTGNQKTSMRLTIVAVAINVALNAVLIAKYGVIGAAWATTISFVLLRFAAYCYVRSHLGIECSAISGLRQIRMIGIRRG